MARKKEFNPDAVVEKAIEIFWQNGYEKTSMQNLVDSLRIGRGSFYNTFSSKHTLFLAALERYSTNATLQLRRLLKGRPLKEALMDLFRALIDDIMSDAGYRGCFITNTTTELAARDPEVAKRVRRHHQECIRCLAEALDMADRQGELSLPRDSRAIALFLANTMDGLRVMAKNNPRREELEAIAETALSVIH